MLELRQIRYFLAVAEELHITRAAARLHIAQPAVSQQLRLLERQVGARLFERSRRGVRLTAAGHAFLPHAQAALASAEAGVAEVQAIAGQLRGRLTVGLVQAASQVGLPTLLGIYHRQHPQVEVTVRQEGSELLVAAVREGAMDLAVVGLPQARPPTGLAVRWLASEPLVVAIPPGHRLEGRRRLRLAQLQEQPLVTLEEGSGLRTLLQGACRAAGFEPRIACATSELTTLLELVADGFGVGVVPASVAHQRRAELSVATLTAPRLERHLGLVWRASGTGSPAARAFLTLTETLPDD